MNLKGYLKKRKEIIDNALSRYLPKENEYPPVIHRAMRYSVLGDGKRIRPILTLAAAEACGGKIKDAMPVACAIEFIHNYSLIHDDLPAMDDDDTRRGRPTCHRKFNEAVAVLAGDALLTLGFSVILTDMQDARRNTEIIRDISNAIGTRGMIGGQVVDMEYEKRTPELPTLEYINVHKTGALIAAALRVGAMKGRGSRKEIDALYKYGKYIGLVFQITDDIIDNEGYALLLGEKSARDEASRLVGRAKRELAPFGRKAEPLRAIADFVLERKK